VVAIPFTLKLNFANRGINVANAIDFRIEMLTMNEIDPLKNLSFQTKIPC